MLGNINGITGAMMVVITLVSSVGNCLTLFVIVRYRPLHDVTGMFLANLAVADLLQSLFGMPLITVSAFKNAWIFGDTLCTLSGVTNSLFCISSMLTLAAISVDRWLVIVYPLRHQSFLTLPRARIVSLYIWVQALVVALFPVLGWSRYVYLSYEFICTVQWEYDKPYTIFLSVTCFVTPLILTIVCYASVTKVACSQARDEPSTTVGEIEAEQSHVISYSRGYDGRNEKIDFMIKEKEVKSRGVRRLEFSHEVKFDPKREAEVPCSSNAKPQTIMNKKSTSEYNDISGNKNSVKVTKLRDDTVLFRENPAEVAGKRVILPSLIERNVSIHPMGPNALSRMNPAESHAKPAWAKEDTFKAEQGIIPEKNETEDSQDKPMSFTKRRTISLGHLARVREWMGERLMNNENTEAILKTKKEMKVVLTLLFVNGTFILCWVPHFIGITCLTFTNGRCPFPDTFFTVTTTMAMLNSGCNPFIYTLTYRKFRKAFKKVLPRFRSNRTGHIDISDG